MALDSRPFILFGRSQLETYQAQIERALDAWMRNWFEDSVVTPQLTVQPLEKLAVTGSAAVWCRLDINRAALYVHFDGLQANDLLPSMLGVPRAKAVSRSTKDGHWEVVQELLNDFMGRWLKPAVSAESFIKARWDRSPLPQSFYERGSGVLTLTLTLSTAKITFAVPPAILQLLPVSTKPGPIGEKRPTSRIAEVLGNESMRLFVAIDAAEKVPFSALSDLNVGDVILLNRKIKEPFNLINADGVRLGGCHIGRRGDNRAIHIAASAAGNLKEISNKP